MEGESYRVNLDVYNGPLDLLLYLIRRDELDIHDIPIARITEQYLQYVQTLKQIDPELAGQFMVLAATLLEIKTRMLLPSAPSQADEPHPAEDPRAELVRRLLEYKAFKDAAEHLKDAAAARAMRYPRGPGRPSHGEDKQFDLQDLQVWDLLDAFNRLMSSIGADVKETQVIYDDTPVELHAADIIDRLNREGPMSFDRIFEGRTNRSEIVGLFLALLELIRQRKIRATQEKNFSEIRIEPVLDPPEGIEESPQQGRYISEAPVNEARQNDDGQREDSEAGL